MSYREFDDRPYEEHNDDARADQPNEHLEPEFDEPERAQGTTGQAPMIRVPYDSGDGPMYAEGARKSAEPGGTFRNGNDNSAAEGAAETAEPPLSGADLTKAMLRLADHMDERAGGVGYDSETLRNLARAIEDGAVTGIEVGEVDWGWLRLADKVNKTEASEAEAAAAAAGDTAESAADAPHAEDAAGAETTDPAPSDKKMQVEMAAYQVDFEHRSLADIVDGIMRGAGLVREPVAETTEDEAPHAAADDAADVVAPPATPEEPETPGEAPATVEEPDTADIAKKVVKEVVGDDAAAEKGATPAPFDASETKPTYDGGEKDPADAAPLLGAAAVSSTASEIREPAAADEVRLPVAAAADDGGAEKEDYTTELDEAGEDPDPRTPYDLGRELSAYGTSESIKGRVGYGDTYVTPPSGAPDPALELAIRQQLDPLREQIVMEYVQADAAGAAPQYEGYGVDITRTPFADGTMDITSVYGDRTLLQTSMSVARALPDGGAESWVVTSNAEGAQLAMYSRTDATTQALAREWAGSVGEGYSVASLLGGDFTDAADLDTKIARIRVRVAADELLSPEARTEAVRKLEVISDKALSNKAGSPAEPPAGSLARLDSYLRGKRAGRPAAPQAATGSQPAAPSGPSGNQ